MEGPIMTTEKAEERVREIKSLQKQEAGIARRIQELERERVMKRFHAASEATVARYGMQVLALVSADYAHITMAPVVEEDHEVAYLFVASMDDAGEVIDVVRVLRGTWMFWSLTGNADNISDAKERIIWAARAIEYVVENYNIPRCKLEGSGWDNKEEGDFPNVAQVCQYGEPDLGSHRRSRRRGLERRYCVQFINGLPASSTASD